MSIDAILQDVKRIPGEICYIQKALHSVTLKDLVAVDPKYVLGTLEWFESRIDLRFAIVNRQSKIVNLQSGA